ncbi:hypothetical protein LOC68_27240 [Blastopirellula sp. JC732]|uniref:Tetratricopeptide repeat protein n=2 Tax=Blastopirellula sediminis TaxID=2894196 RepID=A0A9X1MSL5_9BACT|nr:hypothetical protein [Blastopirellula sediminis]MCC9604595.1 hypothetical protein [Blastopirellula sediminis]MCC9632106.1 hypothetical protein [Blastopirellula sediminis]
MAATNFETPPACAADIRLHLRDLELAATFPPDQFARVREIQTEKQRGDETKDPDEKVRHFQRGREIAAELFGEASHHYITCELSIAHHLYSIPEKREEAFQRTNHLLQVLDSLGASRSNRARDALVVLFALYVMRDDFTKAIETGKQAAALFETPGDKRRREYATLTGTLAKLLNEAGQHEQALHYARTGMNDSLPLNGLQTDDHIRLLREYSRAKIKLQDHDGVQDAWSDILMFTTNVPCFPLHERRELLVEYRSVLQSLALEDRIPEVDLQIAQLKGVSPPEPSPAGEEQQRLSAQYYAGMAKYDQARMEFDLPGKIKALYEFREAAAALKAAGSAARVAEADFVLKDLLHLEKSSEEVREIAIRSEQERRLGQSSKDEKKQWDALVHFEQAMEHAKTAVGVDSHLYACAEVSWAETIVEMGDERRRTEAIAAASHVRKVVEANGAYLSTLYRTTLAVLCRLHIGQNESGPAIEAGEKAVALLEFEDLDQGPYYALLTSFLAKMLNEAGEHRRALHYARSGLYGKPPKYGEYSPFYARLLQEFTRGKVAIDDLDDLQPIYEELIQISDDNPVFPLQRRIEYREEYLAFLNSQGNNQRRDSVVAELANLKGTQPLQKSRYTR